MELSALYAKLDQPDVLARIFHPIRHESPLPAGAMDVDLVMEDGVLLGSRFFPAPASEAVNILFFHGNGEVVADYDDVGPRFVTQGVSFWVVDFRGYGRGNGAPSVGHLVQDSHVVLAQVRRKLAELGRPGPVAVMGRSLGSVSAIELAASEQGIAGLIIESGISRTVPLLAAVGLDPEALGIGEEDGFGNLDKIARVTIPTYILHAQFDQIIPLASAEELQSACGARSKEFQMIPGADHNNILAKTGDLYFQAIARFAKRLGKGQRPRRPGIRG
ncbi:MAG: alpha/beta hydrolase [Thermodesulfobacteriota bacterium]